MPKFQKGNQAAKGRTLPPEQHAIRKLTKVRLEEILHKYMDSTKDELKRIIDNPGETPMIELMVISVMAKGVTQGDQNRLDYLLNRLGNIGPVAQKVEFEDKTDHAEIERLKEEYKAIARKPE